MIKKILFKFIILSLSVLFVTHICAQVGSDSNVPSFSRPIDPDLYLIRPGDKLEIIFVGKTIPDKKWTVDSEGRVIDESSGLINLSGKTLTEAKAEINRILSRFYQFDNMVISLSAAQLISIPVSGAVNKPGIYSIHTSQPVTDLIDSANGASDNAATRNLLFIRYTDTLKFDNIFTINSSSIPLAYAGLELYVPVKQNNIVTIIGEVRSPGPVEIISETTLSEILPFVGGLTQKADSASAYCTNNRSKNVWGVNGLQNGDIIAVPKLKNRASDKVKIFGAVNNPGEYEHNQVVNIQSLINKAGGYTGNANQARITVFRHTESDAWGKNINKYYPLSVPLGETGDFQFVPGDSVFVPVMVGYILVEGLVNSPGIFAFNPELNVQAYISQAGGIIGKKSEVNIYNFDRITRINSIVSEASHIKDGDIIKVAAKESF